MDLTKTHASFTQTSYTLIEALSDHRTSLAAAEELTRVYWPPVYSYLRKSGYDREQAAELTQAFFVEKVLSGRLLEHYDAERGRLRSLMLKAVQNYSVDVHRKAKRAYGAQINRFMMMPSEERWGKETTPCAAFDRRWAVAQLSEAVSQCENYFVSSGKSGHWMAFQARVLQPAFVGTDPIPLEQLARELGFNSPALVSAAVQLVKRRLMIFLRIVISDSLSSPEMLEEEFSESIKILCA